MNDLVCWKCGASLAELTLPLRRLEVCRACSAELHVCKMCVDYDTSVAKSCREPIAEEVKDKEYANFCDYFKPRPGAFRPRDEVAVRKSRSALDDLFGVKPPVEASSAEPSDVEKARAKLDELFKGKG